MFGEIASFISVWDRLFQAKKKHEKTETVADRFILLFEKHDVHRNQIPRFFDHGLTHDDVNSHDKLLSKLTDDILKDVSELFGIRLEWLEGVDKQIYDTHHFYKHPEEYAAFLTQLKTGNDDRVSAQLLLSYNNGGDEDALLLLSEDIGRIGDKAIVRNHLCSGWTHRYYKCRADLAACIAMTEKEHVSIRGSRFKSPINSFCKGESFITGLDELESFYERDRLFRKCYQYWEPQDWVEDPEEFISDLVDGQWGKVSALKQWLNYHDKGYIETGYGDKDSYNLFSILLEKLTH